MANFREKWLSKYFESVVPMEFYRDVFPEGSLQEKGVYGDFKYNGIAVEIEHLEDEEVIKRYTITDDLDMIDELLLSENFVIIAPISYVGKARKTGNSRRFYGLTFDLDGVDSVENIENLFEQFESGFLPKPTYLVSSGNGFHLYYLFEKAVPTFQNILEQMEKMKAFLTKKIWNSKTTSQANKIQFQSIHQAFRMVGGVTKNNERVTAFKIGEKVTFDYLNSFINDVNSQVLEFTYESKLSLNEAKLKYPEWYQKRVIEGRAKGTWKCSKSVYDWWLKRLPIEIKEGHRHYGIFVLAIYAAKCGVDFQTLKKDALWLLPRLQSMTTKGNSFTKKDIIDALRGYDQAYCYYPIKEIELRTGLTIERNRRNYRTQDEHLKRNRIVQEVLNPDWRSGNGRKSKEKLVLEYIKSHPQDSVSQVAKALNISRPTVYRYWSKA